MDRPLPPLLVRQLRVRRSELNMTRVQAARRLLVSDARLRSWELAERRMPLEGAYEYAAVLRASPALRATGGPDPIPLNACAMPGSTAAGALPIVRQLRAGRRARDLPLATVAAQLGWKTHTLQLREIGLRPMSVPCTDAYAEALGYALLLDPPPATGPGTGSTTKGGAG